MSLGRIHVPDEDKTPTDRTPTLEMLFQKIDEVGADAKLAVLEAREAKGHAQNTYNLQLDLNESVKAVELRVRALELTRLWLPLVAIALAVLALLRSR